MGADTFDVAIIGGGVAGMSTAARLQSRGLSTVVLEQHDHIGGCAGYYRRDGFTFDVGATTLVDFQPGGVGGQLLDEIGLEPPQIEIQDAYDVWLPDRTVRLYHDQAAWQEERRDKLGDDERHLEFYAFLDDLSETLWKATRGDVKMPIQGLGDVLRNGRAIGVTNAPLLRYLRWSMADALRAFDVYDETPLRNLFAMLVEDTVHSTLEEAPLLNAVLGTTIRWTGIGRATGGMFGFWQAFEDRYEELGGSVETNRTVSEVTGTDGDFSLSTETTEYRAAQVVSTVPVTVTNEIAAPVVGDTLDEYATMVRRHEGSAIMVFLGVPEEEVDDHDVTHHQLLADYDSPLEDGNNMFVSVSASGDRVSAPGGHRAVMISTHCDVEPWQALDRETYERKKEAAGERLVSLARTVYPNLAENAVVYDVATPITYEEFTDRPRGAVGGYRQTLQNTNQHAVPQDVGIEGFYLAGDTTWPGLGTVACVKGSEIAAAHVLD
ncbi:phytoene desaturase family protein [Halogranum rubrum]|uniref:Phytoene dehydrogenase n=1 Tax=Halogranum salarium B-1 TaxID=1210908 RepID=J2ZDP3_9EURY|nr:NAD(P)/FAD-dependent oxidoreductase [Halogranum salarium]EJN58800.1 phytoene dehydrogenase [Halogranum salarium B-1]